MNVSNSEADRALKAEAERSSGTEDKEEGDHQSLDGNAHVGAEQRQRFFDSRDRVNREREVTGIEAEIRSYWDNPEFLKLINDPGFKAALERACRNELRRFKPSTTYSSKDLEQDVLAHFARWLPQYRHEAKLETVLRRIAHNLLVDIWRNKDERCSSLEELEEAGSKASGSRDARRAGDGRDIVSRILVMELLSKLSKNSDREVFVAYFVEHKRASEISIERGVSRQAVAKQIGRIAKQLRPYML